MNFQLFLRMPARLSFGTSIAMLLLSACGANSQVNTVDYYQRNPDERFAMEKTCNSNPGELKKTPNCVNSREARSRTEGDLELLSNKYTIECRVMTVAPNCDKLKADLDLFVKKNKLREK